MARHHYRSQPALQRSGERHHSLIAIFGLLAMVGVGAGAVVNQLSPASSPGLPTTYPGTAVDQPAGQAAGPTDFAALAPESAAPLVEAPAQMQPYAEAPRAAPTLVKVKTVKPLRRASKTGPKPVVATEVAPPEPTWEEQHDAYVRAKAVYDAGERSAGLDWARQNKIRTAKYCSVAAQRTPAFVEGCLSYLSKGRAGVAAKPSEPADQG